MSILLTPARIGPADIPNRIVMPPMTTRTADAGGFVTGDTLAYYAARARGGTGLITVEMASPERAGRHRRHEIGIFDDCFLPGLSRLVDTIHAAGARAAIQLGHGGGHTRRDICGETPVAPSAVPHPVYETTFETIIPEAMSRERIAGCIEAHADAARRAQAAGFDCVEIHAAHGYLISQFHAPFENRRTDEYGGPLENRARFGLEVLRAVKAAVPGLGVIYRLSVEDFFDGGLRFDEGLQIAAWADRAGADALHVTAGHYRSSPSSQVVLPPMAMPDGPFLGYAAAVKAAVSVPVIAVGRLGDTVLAEDAVTSGKADFIALGRALIADPDWVNKLRRGEPARRCLACNTCINEMRGGARIGCVVNAAAGREAAFANATSPKGKRIAVIGAGPAGLTYASLVADHNDITVFEKAHDAGGAFRFAGKAPLFQEVEADQRSFDRFVSDMVATCEHKGVRFRYAKDPSADPSQLAAFDRIVVATGARYRWGLGPLIHAALALGLGRWPGMSKIFANAAVRDWFYHRARRADPGPWQRLVRPDQRLAMIGDAAQPGKSKPAIASAYAAALQSDDQ